METIINTKDLTVKRKSFIFKNEEEKAWIIIRYQPKEGFEIHSKSGANVQFEREKFKEFVSEVGKFVVKYNMNDKLVEFKP